VRKANVVEAATSRRWRAGALLLVGDFEDAREEIARGREIAARISDPDIRERSIADLDLLEGQALLESDPARAATLAERAARFLSSTGRSARVAESILIQARSFARRGDVEMSLSLLQEALPRIEAQRASIGDLHLRLTYFGLRSAAHNELAALLIDRQRYVEAFAVAERARGRSLLDALEGGTTNPIDVGTLQRSLSPAQTLVVYASLRGELAAWVIKAGSIDFKRWNVTREGLPRAGRHRGAEDRPPMAAQMYPIVSRELIAPVWPLLEGSTAVIFISEAPLHGVPFADLRAPGGRRLIEHFAVVSAPSASTWAALAQRRCQELRSPRVVVAAQSGEAVRLPKARAEAEYVASLYPNALLLMGKDLTASRLRDEFAEADLVHLIAHGAPSSRPFASGMRAFEGERLLTVSEIQGLRLKRCATVVLSGCATAVGAAVGSESITSVANAFIAGGARNVIATLWDVDDSEAAAFMHAFHAELARGRRVEEAFRNARLSRAGAHGDAWAAFQLMGAL
jgi:CHAT domain